MTQIRSVAVLNAVNAAAAVLKASPELTKPVEHEQSPTPPAPKKVLTAAERRPDLYIRNQKLDKMSNRQLRGELNRLDRRNHLPHELQINEKTGAVKGISRGPLLDASLAVILRIMLDNHERGMSSFPR